MIGAAATVAGCDVTSRSGGSVAAAQSGTVDFYGPHQAGIATPAQERLVYGAFDLLDDDRRVLQTLLQQWTGAAADLAAGRPVGPVAPTDPSAAPSDTGEAIGLSPANLTITVGLGRSVFVDDRGADRLGLAHQLPPRS